MEEPQPNAPLDSGVEPTTQPANNGQQPAAQPQDQELPSQNEQPEVSQVDETDAWLQSKGLTRDDPEYLDKITKMAFNSEKQMTKATQEASELRRSLTETGEMPQPGADGLDPALNEFIQDYRRDKQLNQFKEKHSDWERYDQTMGDLVNQAVQTPQGVFTRRDLINAGILTLDDIYAMAKGTAPDNTDEIKTQATQETLQSLANAQRAGGGSAHASSANPQAPKIDPVLEGIKRSRGQ